MTWEVDRKIVQKKAIFPMKKDCDLNSLILESRTDLKEQFLTVRKEFWQKLWS